MKKVAIITDSTAYLPDEMIKSLDLHVVPLTLHWDGESYRDGVDIPNTIPITSQTTVGEFERLFKELLDQDREVFAMLISSGISGTVESALQAQTSFEGAPLVVMDTQLVSMALGFMVIGAPLVVMDTQLVSMALGFMVIEVARAAQNGASLAECKALAEDLYPKIGVYFTVDTLKYLNKGGRINTAKRLMGAALNIKPIMEIRKGLPAGNQSEFQLSMPQPKQIIKR